MFASKQNPQHLCCRKCILWQPDWEVSGIHSSVICLHVIFDTSLKPDTLYSQSLNSPQMFVLGLLVGRYRAKLSFPIY